MKNTELEEKILSCFKHVTIPSLTLMLGIEKSKVYRVLKKHKIVLKPYNKFEGSDTAQGRDGNRKLRFCTPYKNSQLG